MAAAQTHAVPAAAEVAVTSAPATTKKKLFLVAAEECIEAYISAKAWSETTCAQVRTAARLLDFAAGGNLYVEDIRQHHLRQLNELFDRLPNRWGRTKRERRGGLEASLRRASTMDSELVGITQGTRTKHLTWIQQVLDFAEGDGEGGHQPAMTISFKKLRKGVGNRANKRRRDKRSSWSRAEIATLLAAPVWAAMALEIHLAAGIVAIWPPQPIPVQATGRRFHPEWRKNFLQNGEKKVRQSKNKITPCCHAEKRSPTQPLNASQ